MQILYIYINKYEYNKYFPFLAMFSQNFDYFTPKIAFLDLVSLAS